MKLQEGVNLHFIPSDKFTTNQIKIRFTAPMDKKTVANRVLVANMLEMGNQDYPTNQEFRWKLAELYGATLSTSVSKRGRVHMVDISVSFIKENYLFYQENLTKEILDLLVSTLQKPLGKNGVFQKEIFEIEKKNLISYLESEVEDNFYHADVELNKLYFQEEALQIPRVSNLELVEDITAKSAYQALQNMLKLDRIDIFVLGEVDKELTIEAFRKLAFTYRNPKLEFEYHQTFSPVLREKSERKFAKQSILELAYNLQVLYKDEHYYALLLLNGLFGAFSHSRLFTQLREKDGLAYTIGSQLNIFSGMLKVYAGIDRDNRLKTLKGIHRELLRLKQGQFSEEELELTKKMYLHSAQVSQDKGRTLIEQVFNQVILGKRHISVEEFMDKISQVKKEDIVKVSQLIRLQAVYFMEGVE
ncbi:insulinase family protein [Streptococcus gallolyticus]|uniref:EF-P 5-aminopentanol modification-associated protein YfmF n=1 Tax=Streptococcus hepaticus TaxID=3349163 RepID=UPI001C941C6E|nr:insulinase family protein [Streptococcus gallolyticus]MBY5040789.1 insulinase family protein [Streptococcus gallolyticus]